MGGFFVLTASSKARRYFLPRGLKSCLPELSLSHFIIRVQNVLDSHPFTEAGAPTDLNFDQLYCTHRDFFAFFVAEEKTSL